MEQVKINSSGQRVRWEVNQELICQTIPWAKSKPQVLAKEVKEMGEHFPFFYLVLGPDSPKGLDKLLCPICKNIIVFAEDVICIGCKSIFSSHRNPALVYIGQIPSLIGYIHGGILGDKKAKLKGRPFLKNLQDMVIKDNFDWRKNFSLLKEKEENIFKVYFSPTIYSFYPSNWPSSPPNVYMEKEYFSEVLFKGFRFDFSDFHAYPGEGDLLRLCNYRGWHTVSMRTVLQQRIVPKIVIDLMVADLITVGKLNSVISSLGTSLHGLYNYIGKGDNSQRFKSLYDKYISF